MKQKTQIQSSLVLICMILNWYTLIGQTNSNEVIDENKQLIEKLFDSIGYRSIYLVLKDRVYESDTTNADKIKGLKLVDFPSELKWDGEKRVKSFVEEFLRIKKHYIDQEYTSKQEFKETMNSFITSSFFKDSIITSKKVTDKRYIQLKSNIKQDIEHAASNFNLSEIKDKVLKQENNQSKKLIKIIPEAEKKPASTQGFETIIKDYSAILLIILIISLALNILLGILLFRTKKSIVSSTDHSIEVVSETTPNSLSIQEIKEITKKTYASWIADFTSAYTSDCIATIKDTLEKSKSELLENVQSNRFSSKHELQTSINQKLKNSTISLEASLKKCNDRQQAKEKIEQELQSHSFIPKHVNETISSEEIHTLIERSKRNLISELPVTISNDELSIHITETKLNINLEMEKKVQENLTVYFPFTNAEGAIADDKKSKIKERDSALQFIIDPNDTSRATFSLLYDYPDMMQAAIQSYDIFLLPVCNLSSENFNRNGIAIEQIGEDGEMQLEGNQWKIVKKITIKII